LPRYLKAMSIRLRKLNNAGLNRDTLALDQVAPLWEDYKLRATAFRRVGKYDASLVQFRWMMEELRVSLFSQELKTAVPVSVQRLEKLWEQVPLR
jgi:ATP-dependent helicase HrpA